MNTVQSPLERLYLMHVATMQPRAIPFVCYLAQTGDRNILIDSGLPDSSQTLPAGQQPLLGKNVIEQLAAIGLQPEQIDTVVITHFDGDHIGQIDKFPQANLVVQRAQYEQAMAGHPRFAPYRALWDQPVERYTFVEGDTELAPGIELLDTSGHVAGHQSLLLRLPKSGVVLLAIDAVPNAAAFTLDREVSGANDDNSAVLKSTQKLIDLAEQEGASLVIFGHELEQWQKLKKLPEYYD